MRTRTLRRRRLELTARLIAAPEFRREYNAAMTRRSEDREWREHLREDRARPRPLSVRLREDPQRPPGDAARHVAW